MPHGTTGTGPPARHVKAWASAAEKRSLATRPSLLKEGRSNWRALNDDPIFQTLLARELCETRAPELTLAYKNLVWMAPGFRQVSRQGRPRLTNQVCALFVVRNKGSLVDGHPQMLPKALVVYAEYGGTRQVFAVPTDVQDASAFAGAIAQSNSGIWVTRPPGRTPREASPASSS